MESAMLSAQLQQRMREIEREMARAIKQTESKSNGARIWPHLEKREAVGSTQKGPRHGGMEKTDGGLRRK